MKHFISSSRVTDSELEIRLFPFDCTIHLSLFLQNDVNSMPVELRIAKTEDGNALATLPARIRIRARVVYSICSNALLSCCLEIDIRLVNKS